MSMGKTVEKEDIEKLQSSFVVVCGQYLCEMCGGQKSMLGCLPLIFYLIFETGFKLSG